MRILYNLKWDLSGSIFGYGAEFVTTIILARLLSPEEFGLVSIGLAFIVVVNILSEFGFKYSIIQSSQELSSKTLSSVFYLNLVIGIFFIILLFSISHLVATFYGQPSIKIILEWLCIIVLFNSISIVPTAQLSRNLNFRKLNVILLTCKISSSILGIILALLGYGIFALIWQQITYSIVYSFLILYNSKWRPSLIFSYKSVKPLFSFSTFVFFSQIFNQILVRLDELVIGKLFTPAILGNYGRSNSIIQIFTGVSSKSINSVIFSVLSRKNLNDILFLRIYQNLFEVIVFISIFVSGLIYISSNVIINGLFGEQWEESIGILKVLSIGLFSFPINNFLIIGLLSKGFAKEDFIFGILRKILRILVLISAFVFGFKFFLYAFVFINIISISINIYMNEKYLNISIKYYYFKIIPPLITAFIGCYILSSFKFHITNLCLDVFIKGTVFFSFYLIILMFLNKNLFRNLKDLRNDFQ